MSRLARVLPVVAIVGLAMCREAPTGQRMTRAPLLSRDDNAPAVSVFRVDFNELNASGVKAQATLTMTGGDLTVTLDAVGRTPGQIHPQHIHGFTTKASTCPTAANDTNGDGTISFAEGLPAFGPVQVDLQPYPTPANPAGSTHYRMTFVASHVPFSAAELAQKTMVLHGDFLAGSYVASLPVACGQVQRVN